MLTGALEPSFQYGLFTLAAEGGFTVNDLYIERIAAPLHAVPGGHNAIYSDPTAANWADTELLSRCPNFQEALARFDCPLLSMRLLRLASGAVINKHRDYGLGLEAGEMRLHVVVATNPQVESRIDGVSYYWAEGGMLVRRF